MMFVINGAAKTSVSVVKEIHQSVNGVIRVKPGGKNIFVTSYKRKTKEIFTLSDGNREVPNCEGKGDDTLSDRSML